MQDYNKVPPSAGLQRRLTGQRLASIDTALAERILVAPSLKVRIAVMSGLAVILGLLWAQIVGTWAFGPVLPLSSLAPKDAVSSADQRPSAINLAALVDSDPFFASVAQAPARTAAVFDAPETSLDLKLFGVRAGDDPESGTAIVRTPDKRQGTFRVGESLMKGVRLDQVLPDRIVISRSGVRESLYLNPETGRSRNTTQQAPASVPSVLPSGALSIADALARLQLRPRLQGNAINGFYVTADSDPALFRQAGLQTNDVVMAVNTVRLVSAERISDVLDELRNATSARLEIERDGSPKTMTFTLGGAPQQ
jgi:general secretion pathway protein C